MPTQVAAGWKEFVKTVKGFWNWVINRFNELTALIFVVAFFLLAAALIVRPSGAALWPPDWAKLMPVIVVAFVLFAILGIFPLTYFAYQTHRKESKVKRLSNDFKLLGLANQDEIIDNEGETVRQLYDRVYNWQQYMLYILLILGFSVMALAIYAPLSPFMEGRKNTIGLPVGPASTTLVELEPTTTAQSSLIPEAIVEATPSALAVTTVITSGQALTLTTLLTTTAVISPEQTISLTTKLTTVLPTSSADVQPFIPLNPDIIKLMFFAFLGAYVYSALELIRRYNTFDLEPQVYAGILVRMVAAVALVFAGSLLIFNAGSNYQSPPSAPGFATLWLPGIIAFVIGAFPSRGLDWFWRLAEPVLAGRATDAPTALPIDHLYGISSWHAARLQQIGIDDAQNLAGADLAKLLLTTPFDAQVLVNWVDQAMLYTRVGSKINTFREQQISTFTGLQQAVDSNKKDEQESKNLALRLGLADAAHLQRLLAAPNTFPNYSHLQEYYTRTAEVIHRNAEDAQDIIIGEVEHRNVDKAIEFGEKRIENCRKNNHQPDSDLWVIVGMAYYSRARAKNSQSNSEKRREDLGNAIRLFTEAQQSASNVAEAYYGRALCRLELAKVDNADKVKNVEKAINDCTQAIDHNRHFAKAFNERAIAYVNLERWELALRDLDEALRLDDRLATAYYHRGTVRLKMALDDFDKAKGDFEKAHLCGYPDRGAIKLGLGIMYVKQKKWQNAEQALTEALGLLDEKRQKVAYWRRVEVYRQQQRFDAALDDLRRLIHSDDGRDASQSQQLKERYYEIIRLKSDPS
jgi:tetratricopeptide (TPR) repeat protein